MVFEYTRSKNKGKYNISVNFTGIVNNLELEKKKYINENVL